MIGKAASPSGGASVGAEREAQLPATAELWVDGDVFIGGEPYDVLDESKMLRHVPCGTALQGDAAISEHVCPVADVVPIIGGHVDEGVLVDDRLNTVCTTNDEGFWRVVHLYARPGDVIVDPTFGRGVFWKQVDRALYDVRATDLTTHGIDMRALPYEDASVDMVVNDPPYRYTPAANQKVAGLDDRYNLQGSAPTRTQGVIELYVDGMREAHRVLRKGGFLVVKCQDTVQDGSNLWVHNTLMAEAEAIGFVCRDLLIVNPPTIIKTRWARQKHLRKAHSYFLVFRKGGHFPLGTRSVMRRG